MEFLIDVLLFAVVGVLSFQKQAHTKKVEFIPVSTSLTTATAY